MVRFIVVASSGSLDEHPVVTHSSSVMVTHASEVAETSPCQWFMANQTVLFKKFLHLAPKIKTLMECCNCVSLAQRVKGVVNESFKENTT